MKREAEVNVMGIVLLLLSEADKQRQQDAYITYAKVPWRTFDALADAFRSGGVDPNTPHLGAVADEAELAEDEALIAERVESEHEQELDRKLRERPTRDSVKGEARVIENQWFGEQPAHAHLNLLEEWELCTDNDCEVYAT